MASLSLKCPFCCDENFTSHLSLKYHILSLIDNILCPACNCRFDNIIELTEHLDRQCNEVEQENISATNVQIKQEVENLYEVSTEDERNFEVETIQAQDQVIAQQTTAENDPPMYHCQMCNMHFESIEEHLQEYHEGDDVILETTDHIQMDQNEINADLDVETAHDYVFEIPESQDDTRNANEILEEGEFIDNEGRAYTRKVVKIDKFWEDKSLDVPMTEKYVIENGKIRKFEEDEDDETTTDNKKSIIEIHQCPKCCLQFPKLDHFAKHICDPSKIKNKFRCIYCSTIFQNYHSLISHLKSHLVQDEDGNTKRIVTIGPHTCEICKTMFPSFKSLRLHQRMHDPVKEKTPEAPVKYSLTGAIEDDDKQLIRDMFMCPICNNSFDKEYEEVHLKSHSKEDNYNCTVCNRKFFTKENLEMHAKVHSNIKKFACSYCKKPFATYDALEEHVTNLCQKRQYECGYCGRRFTRPHEKVKHERIHTGEKPHVCQICGKAFRVSYCLTLHLRTHSGTRPYQCNHCGKRFKSHSVYNHHLLTHSDVRAYKCPLCPKAFKTAVQLAGHKNSHIKPFTCTECNRPFASLYAVRAHMETHKRNNNLKYVCWLCGATYARAFALRDHMKEHVRNNDDDIPASEETTVINNVDNIDVIADEMGTTTIIEESCSAHLTQTSDVKIEENDDI